MKKLLSILFFILFIFCPVFAQTPASESRIVMEDVAETLYLTKQEKNQIKRILFTATGMNFMFPRNEFEPVKTFKDLYEYLHKYVKDDHFVCNMYLNPIEENKPRSPVVATIRQNVHVLDDNSIVSAERNEKVTRYIETENAEYIRSSCNCVWAEDEKAFNQIKGNKDYIIFDYRSNGGGSMPIDKFFQQYKGTIIILQDNYSYSAAELGFFAENYKTPKDIILVGQHSGGCFQGLNPAYTIFGRFNMGYSKYLNIDLGSRKGKNPSNSHWEGEGIGFKPDVWVNRNEDFVPTLEGMGVNMVDIQTGEKIVIK